jgi:hypothetical protein
MVGYLGSANTAKITSSKLSFNASTGTITATAKSFLIDHPSKPGMMLQYGSLESPYNGIRLTGRGTVVNGVCVVELPDYIDALVQEENVNIQITNIKHGKSIWIDTVEVVNNKFAVAMNDYEFDVEYQFYWSFTAIRKDIGDLKVEF